MLFRIRRRYRIVAALSILLAIGLGPYLASRIFNQPLLVVSPESKPLEKPPQSLRIAIYNLAHGRGATGGNWSGTRQDRVSRIDAISDFIKSLNADIVVLNEVDFNCTWSGHQNQAEAIALRAGYAHRVEQRNTNFHFIYGSWQYGNAILSRFPITDVELADFPAYRNWERWLLGSKVGAVATLQISSRQQLRVLGIHLEHRDETTRCRAANRIAELAIRSTVPMVLAGDFNSTPSSFPHSQQSKKRENAMDLLLETELFSFPPNIQPTKNQLTFSATEPRMVIDWILIPPQWKFGKYEAFDCELSDHRPVVATLELGDPKSDRRDP